MSKILTSVVVAALGVVLFVSVPTSSAKAAAPTAAALFTVPGGIDAPIQWLENIFLGDTAPETFLDSVGAEDNNLGGAIQTGLRQIHSWYSYAMLVLASFLLLYLSLPKISSEREFEQLQELMTELGREVNRCDLTIGKLPPQSRSQELLSRDPQTVGTAAAQHWRTGNGTDQAARRS